VSGPGCASRSVRPLRTGRPGSARLTPAQRHRCSGQRPLTSRTFRPTGRSVTARATEGGTVGAPLRDAVAVPGSPSARGARPHPEGSVGVGSGAGVVRRPAGGPPLLDHRPTVAPARPARCPGGEVAPGPQDPPRFYQQASERQDTARGKVGERLVTTAGDRWRPALDGAVDGVR